MCGRRDSWTGRARSTFGIGLTALLTGITYGIQPYGDSTTGWTNPWVLGTIAVGLAVAGGVLLDRAAGRRTDGQHPAVPVGVVRAGQSRRPDVVGGPRRAAVHAHHLAAGHLASVARLQLRVDSAVGRHLHAADDGGLLGLRAACRLTGRPVRGAPVHRRRDAADGGDVHRAGDDPGGLQLLGLRGAGVLQRPRRRHLHRTQHRRDHVERARRRARRRFRSTRDVLQRRLVPVDRHLLLADDRRAWPTRCRVR